MKLKYIYIPLLFFSYFISYIESEERISDIFNAIFKKMKLLPYGSTIFFAKNGKCTKDSNTPLFCLINNSIYKVEENNQSFVFNISEYNDDIYYELNILNNTNTKSITCILSYINNSAIYFLYYTVNEENLITQKKYNSTLNIIPIINNINCQKESFLSQLLTCFYVGENKNFIEIKFNKDDNFFIQQFEQEHININDSNLDNSFIIFSLLKNQLKYFLCLNSSREILKIYSKKNILGRRLNFKETSPNEIEEFTFKCNNKGSLLIFSFFDNKNEGVQSEKNCLANYKNQNIGEYYFFLNHQIIILFYPNIIILVA